MKKYMADQEPVYLVVVPVRLPEDVQPQVVRPQLVTVLIQIVQQIQI